MSQQFIDYWAARLEFLDVHYHASPDNYQRRYNALEAGRLFSRYGGGCVLKNHLGSTAALASLVQDEGLPVFGSVVLNDIAGGLDSKVVKQALCQYSFPFRGRLLVHLPTVVKTTHCSVMNRPVANESVLAFAQSPARITDDRGNLRPELMALIDMAGKSDIVISTGHASKREIFTLLEAVDRAGGCKVMLNQPANPITGMKASCLKELGQCDWLYVEQTALTVWLGYQSEDDLYEVLSDVNNVVFSSDSGQLCQPDIDCWLTQSASWFDKAGLSFNRRKAITLINPLKMLAPG